MRASARGPQRDEELQVEEAHCLSARGDRLQLRTKADRFLRIAQPLAGAFAWWWRDVGDDRRRCELEVERVCEREIESFCFAREPVVE